MSCGCGGGCTEKMESLRDQIKILEGRIFSLEARLASTQPIRDPYTAVPAWAPRPAGTMHSGCPVCSLGADGKPMGYVCPRNDCPSRITC
jgi:hypothetical protein